MTGIDQKVFLRAFHSLWDHENRQRIDGDMAEWSLWHTHTLENYVNQVLNGAINHYNSALTTAYNRIATLEAEVTCLQWKGQKGN